MEDISFLGGLYLLPEAPRLSTLGTKTRLRSTSSGDLPRLAPATTSPSVKRTFFEQLDVGATLHLAPTGCRMWPGRGRLLR